ncbi:hypothetical protein DPMN_119549 [Dreissena polymorpha]|uniref:Alpha-glucosidase n=3 Tax=Dreissena polymorpha TaxID=45954 RepID=A0A9D4GM42_DREPO|nr:hypothetical protein DPMN_119549 [Dreissena polymorpha]
MGLIGYPFVMTDMVGWNAYHNTFHDAELFIRWTQLSAFFPLIQLSIAPWNFNDTIEGNNVIDVVKHFVDLHTNLSETFIAFANISTQTGEPIIRPLWWIDPLNKTSITCEDEFLIGDKYLVAPVLNKGACVRNIYFPTGTLQALSTAEKGNTFTGPMMTNNYSVPLNETAYFVNVIYLSG